MLLSVSKWCAARCPPLRLRCARWGGQHYYQKIGQKWTGTLSADTTIQEHRDRGDTYNGQFFTSGPLIDGVLGMKAYGSPAKRAKDDPQSSSNATGETPRIEGFTSRDGNVEFARRRTKTTILPQATALTVRIAIPIPLTATALSGRTTL